MSVAATGPTGGSLPHNNMPPYVVVNYIIALQGIFPPRP
jgi:microcystin-dependent protein